MHYWWECILVESLWKTVWKYLKKLKIEIPYDPIIPPLVIYPKTKQKQKQTKQNKTFIQKDMYSHMFTAALFTIDKIWKQLKCPSIEEWIKKM